MTLANSSAWALAGLAVAAALVHRASRLPPLGRRSTGHAPSDRAHTRLGRVLAPLLARHAGLNGIHALPDGRDALALRLALANAADVSLDVQYYIWENDLAGTLLLQGLRRAASRGVRVRLLLDDNGIAGMDAILAGFDALAGVEVRLFNPSAIRKPRLLGVVADFARLNRRMHNKSFTADGLATIVGGRNIGDRYFATGADRLFLDLDVLCIGPATTDVSNAFARYWDSGSAYPAALLLPPATKRQTAAASAAATAIVATRAARDYRAAIEGNASAAQFVGGTLTFDWAAVRLLIDDPAKALGRAAPGGLVIDDLAAALGHPLREVRVVSGYLVPSAALVAQFAAMIRRGVRIDVVTNAFDASDVKLVSAGYGKWRKPMLRAGIGLYEVHGGTAPVRRKAPGGSGFLGSGSGGSFLHAKTFFVDRARVFIGSFNLDPRSARLNTEDGLVIESPALADRMARSMEHLIGDIAYQVRLDGDGHLFWLERTQGGDVRHDREPGTTWRDRAVTAVLAKLPIDWLL